MSERPSRTWSEDSPAPETPARVWARLVLSFEAERALASPRCFALREAEAWVVGRKDSAGVRLDDRWMSSEHARLEHTPSGWLVVDLRSKNGVRVNGTRHVRTHLAHGDVLEVGHSLLFFEEYAFSPGAGPELPADVAGLRTVEPSLAHRFGDLASLACSGVPVLILGPTGTGKELAARAVHQLSGRKGPFVPVNCGALPETLVAAELFGSRKGAYSGSTDRPGLALAAQGGTLFLDEVGDLPLAAQATLLRLLQEGEVTALGSTARVPVDLRCVAATNQPLEANVSDGRFRQDLFARLDGFRLTLPSLAERRCDLGALVAHRLAELDAVDQRFQPDAARALFAYAWPHNVRELHLAVERAVHLAQGEPVQPSHLPPAVTERRAVTASEAPGDDALREQLLALLRRHAGNVAAVARELGKGRMQVHRWLKRYGLSLEDFRPR